jgi:hypothetical protein
MNEILKAFRRQRDGTWVCINPATLHGPNGRIQVTPRTAFARGTTFMGADLQLATFGRPSHH